MRRTLLFLALVAVVAAACGGDGAVDAGPVPGRPDPTVATSTPDTTPGTTTAGTTQLSIWLARGEKLEPVTRVVPSVPRIGAEAVKALLAGPTATETRNGLATAVPTDTRFLDLAIDGAGIARVDLSRDFESGGGTLGMTLRLAQVTCTVGQFPTVKGVRFALNGELVNVFSGDGLVIDRPVTCDSYREVLAQPGQPVAFSGIWPFASKAELDAYAAGTDRTFRDPVATARQFAVKYLGMVAPASFGFQAGGPGEGEVPMGFGTVEGGTPVPIPRPTFTVVLRQMGAQGSAGAWTVVAVASPSIVVSRPGPLEPAASPVRVAGQAHTFEGNVAVEVREDGMLAGQSLGTGFVTGGGDMLRPFSGDIAFRSPTKPAGAVVFVERSAADGQSILRAAVVRVRF
ncbi:MAG: GerMN domain-containing protein [Acidimicrobiales bacterium]